jgi:hypothetical protein
MTRRRPIHDDVRAFGLVDIQPEEYAALVAMWRQRIADATDIPTLYRLESEICQLPNVKLVNALLSRTISANRKRQRVVRKELAQRLATKYATQATAAMQATKAEAKPEADR